MAFVSASVVGSAIVSGTSAATSVPYNIVQINGEGIVDKLRVLDYAMTTSELDALNISDVYTWDTHTLLYAEFTNNLEAGSTIFASSVESWTVVRFCCGGIQPTIIATELDAAITSVVDYTAVKPYTYYYRIYPIAATAVMADIQSNTIEMCYDYYSFLDPTTDEGFIFQGNLENQTIPQNSPAATYEGFTQYPIKSQGMLAYDSASFVGLLGMVNNGIYENDTVAMYAALKAFIRNGNEKIMKDRKGNIRRVFTEDVSMSIDEKPSELPTMIAFSWTEVGAV
jgi:hypothetical protein